jgi:hypothetical protein
VLFASLLEVVAQQDRGGNVIHCTALPPGRRFCLGNNPSSFPARQPLIHEFRFDSQLLLYPRRKSRRFLRHGTSLARDMHGIPYQNVSYSVFPANVAEAPEVIPAISPLERRMRLRGESQIVRQRKPDPLPAVVNRENTRTSPVYGLSGRDFPGVGTSNGCHLRCIIRDARRFLTRQRLCQSDPLTPHERGRSFGVLHPFWGRR